MRIVYGDILYGLRLRIGEGTGATTRSLLSSDWNAFIHEKGDRDLLHHRLQQDPQFAQDFYAFLRQRVEVPETTPLEIETYYKDVYMYQETAIVIRRMWIPVRENHHIERFRIYLPYNSKLRIQIFHFSSNS